MSAQDAEGPDVKTDLIKAPQGQASSSARKFSEGDPTEEDQRREIYRGRDGGKYYVTLGVTPDASYAEITDAYRTRFVWKVRPSVTEEERQAAKLAYHTIADPIRRACYDPGWLSSIRSSFSNPFSDASLRAFLGRNPASSASFKEDSDGKSPKPVGCAAAFIFFMSLILLMAGWGVLRAILSESEVSAHPRTREASSSLALR